MVGTAGDPGLWIKTKTLLRVLHGCWLRPELVQPALYLSGKLRPRWGRRWSENAPVYPSAS